jgi:membrane protein CcdC involved in cytochrome C biogenesis
MPPFSSIKFGLELAAVFFTVIVFSLAVYWRTSEYFLKKQLHRQHA